MNGELEDLLQPGDEALLPEETQEPEKGEIEPTEQVTQAEATPAEDPTQIAGLKAALIAERRKRQEYERQLSQQSQQQPQFDPQVFHQDPSSIAYYVDQRLLQERANLSRSMASAQYSDYDEMEALFIQEAEANPALIYEMQRSENPALFAYKTAQALKDYRDAQSGDLEKRIRAEIEAKVRAELGVGAKRLAASVPPDLSATRSVGTSEPLPDDSLESILRKD